MKNRITTPILPPMTNRFSGDISQASDLQRRDFLRWGMLGAAAMLLPGGSRRFAAAPPLWPVEKDLKITGVRLVKTRPKTPLPSYTPDAGSYWTTREAARPIEFYPKYTGIRGRGSKWMPDPGSMGSFVVEIETDNGLGQSYSPDPPRRW